MLIYITGKSCSGKDTVVKHLCGKTGYKKIVRNTTRPPREGEDEGCYNFISQEEFNKTRHAEVRNYRMADGKLVSYGTPMRELSEALHSDEIYVTWGAMDALLAILPLIEESSLSQRLFVVKLDVSIETQIKRYSLRCKNDADYKEMCRRIHAEAEEYLLYEEELKKLKGNLKKITLCSDSLPAEFEANMIKTEAERYFSSIQHDLIHVIEKIKVTYPEWSCTFKAERHRLQSEHYIQIEAIITDREGKHSYLIYSIKECSGLKQEDVENLLKSWADVQYYAEKINYNS